MHLGITPDRLKGVDEPEYPALEENPKRSRQQPSWFEAQDLLVVKAGYNDITALQPEICLFGNLKSLDVRNSVNLQYSGSDYGIFLLSSTEISSIRCLRPYPSSLSSQP